MGETTKFLAHQLIQTFFEVDEDMSGVITREEFEGKCSDAGMLQYFKEMNIHVTEALSLYSLIDIDGDGCVTPLEFVSGFLRLRGPATAMDLAVHVHNSEQMFHALMDAII